MGLGERRVVLQREIATRFRLLEGAGGDVLSAEVEMLGGEVRTGPLAMGAAC